MQAVHQTSGEAHFDGEWEVAVFGVTSFEEMMILVVVRHLTEYWLKILSNYSLHKKTIPKHSLHEKQLLCDDLKEKNASKQLMNIWSQLVGKGVKTRGEETSMGKWEPTHRRWETTEGNWEISDWKWEPNNRKWDLTDGKRKQPTRNAKHQTRNGNQLRESGNLLRGNEK